MADEDLSDSLATAVADHADIDWTAERGDPTEGDPELLRSFRVIADIGRTSRAGITADQQRGLVGPARLSRFIAVLAALTLLAAGVGVVASLSGALAVPLPWASTFNVLLFGVSSSLLLLGGSRDRRVHALGLLFLTIGAAFARPAVVAAGAVWPWLSTVAQTFFADAFLALALWQFVWVFPSEPRQPGARKAGRAFLAAGTIVGIVLFLANALLRVDAGLPFLPADAEAALQWFDRTSATQLYWPLLFGIAGPALPYLVWKSRVENAGNRRKVRWFVASLGVGLSPFLLAVTLTPVIPALADPWWRVRVGVILYAALASIVPSTAYAVVVSHVMDLHLVLRRTLQYGLARTSVWCAILLPLAYVAVDVYRHRDLTVSAYLSGGRPLQPLLLSLVSFVVLTFRHQVLQRVDRWFLRETADHTESLARLEHGFRSSRTIRDISTVLKREVERSVRPLSVAVMVMNDGALVSLESNVPPLRQGSALLDLLRSIRTEVQLSYRADGAVAGLLPPDDRAWLASTGFGLFSPLMGSGNALLGVLGIGEGRNGLPYTERDCMLITAMSGQAALKLENSRLREHASPAPASGAPARADWENEPAERCTTCGAVWKPATRHCACGNPTVEAALPLNVKGKFQVERFIGAGGTGVVYQAVDLALDRKVAIKTLPAIRLKHAARLHREARAMGTMLHPNLAVIYGAEEWKDTPLLIFEYLEGGTLLDSLRRGPIGLDEVLELGTLLADALDFVHTSGVLHRDIKPSNIGYTSTGVPKLLDFGLAAILDRSRAAGTPPAVLPADPSRIAELAWGHDPSASLTVTQQLVGTPLYLSPEALAGAEPAASFDLWGLSMVLYEAYAGRHPLAAASVLDVVRAVQRERVPDVREFRPECPPACAAFFNDALSGVSARRPSTAAHLRASLQGLRSTLPPRLD